MSQLLVCTMYLPELAVSGSLTADWAQLPEHAAGTVASLKTVNVVGPLLWTRLVCGPFSVATLAALVCGPRGGFLSESSSFVSRARAARSAAACTPAGTVLAALPGTAA